MYTRPALSQEQQVTLYDAQAEQAMFPRSRLGGNIKTTVRDYAGDRGGRVVVQR